MTKPTEPTNSIDSELVEILKAYKRYPFGTDSLPHITGDEALQAIKSLYISRKELEEALKDETYDDLVLEDNKMHQAIWEGRRIRNIFRAELRAKLLPPTKGDTKHE